MHSVPILLWLIALWLYNVNGTRRKLAKK